MRKLILLACLLYPVLSPLIAQVNCEDYRVVSIYDLPPSPQFPGGNHLLLLLSLDKDHPNNIDNYANLYFINALGDTISIPTGPNSTLPRFASDTIPYVLQLNTLLSNQDFPINFQGHLVIEHSTLLQCQVPFSQAALNNRSASGEFQSSFYPNPCQDILNIESTLPIDRLCLINGTGQLIKVAQVEKSVFDFNMETFSAGQYLILLKFQNGSTLVKRILKQ